MNIFYCQGCSEIRAAKTNLGKYKCRKCGGDVINLYVNEVEWDTKTLDEKKAIIRARKNASSMVVTMDDNAAQSPVQAPPKAPEVPAADAVPPSPAEFEGKAPSIFDIPEPAAQETPAAFVPPAVEIPAAPDMPEAPAAFEAPKAPAVEMPAAPDMPEAPAAFEAPEAPAFEIPAAPDMPEAPAAFEAPEAPAVEMPAPPEASAEPVTSPEINNIFGEVMDDINAQQKQAVESPSAVDFDFGSFGSDIAEEIQAAPGGFEIPAAPEAPAVEMPAPPEVPEAPVAFEAPEAPAVEVPTAPEIPEMPAEPAAFEAPEAPAVEVPAAPEMPEMPAEPAAFEAPEAPAVEIPAAPEMPEMPAEPAAFEAPEAPAVEIPAAPEMPEMPAGPAAFETPEAPAVEIPAAPEMPEMPAGPAAFEAPAEKHHKLSDAVEHMAEKSRAKAEAAAEDAKSALDVKIEQAQSAAEKKMVFSKHAESGSAEDESYGFNERDVDAIVEKARARAEESIKAENAFDKAEELIDETGADIADKAADLAGSADMGAAADAAAGIADAAGIDIPEAPQIPDIQAVPDMMDGAVSIDAADMTGAPIKSPAEMDAKDLAGLATGATGAAVAAGIAGSAFKAAKGKFGGDADIPVEAPSPADMMGQAMNAAAETPVSDIARSAEDEEKAKEIAATLESIRDFDKAEGIIPEQMPQPEIPAAPEMPQPEAAAPAFEPEPAAPEAVEQVMPVKVVSSPGDEKGARSAGLALTIVGFIIIALAAFFGFFVTRYTSGYIAIESIVIWLGGLFAGALFIVGGEIVYRIQKIYNKK